ncbi:MAG: hypothetical protein R3A45_12265 [Bdellovibrionota bacterium]
MPELSVDQINNNHIVDELVDGLSKIFEGLTTTVRNKQDQQAIYNLRFTFKKTIQVLRHEADLLQNNQEANNTLSRVFSFRGKPTLALFEGCINLLEKQVARLDN